MSSLSKPPAALHPTPTVEDYLAIIYAIQRDGETIIAARLAESLEVSPPTVTVTLRRMERDGWLVMDGKKGIQLTPAGHEAACNVIRRHMLTEWLLARMLKVPWSRIHSEAHQIEHSISKEIEMQMLTNLDNPQLCPHGNPLPGYENLSANWIQLTLVQVGALMTIRRIHEKAEDDAELMQFLEDNGIIPGVQVKLVEKQAFNQTLLLEVNGKIITLGFAPAQYMWVDLVEEKVPSH